MHEQRGRNARAGASVGLQIGRERPVAETENFGRDNEKTSLCEFKREVFLITQLAGFFCSVRIQSDDVPAAVPVTVARDDCGQSAFFAFWDQNISRNRQVFVRRKFHALPYNAAAFGFLNNSWVQIRFRFRKTSENPDKCVFQLSAPFLPFVRVSGVKRMAQRRFFV